MIKETNEWNKYLSQMHTTQTDIYFTEEYVKLYENDESYARCFIYQENEKLFLFPYLKRKISTEILSQQYYDLESQYGYGGPISNSTDKVFVTNAIHNMKEALLRKKIIAGFIRTHPLLENYKLLESHFDVIYDRKTVAMNLDLSEEKIWMEEIHSKHRNVIRKAESNNLKYIVDDKFEYLSDFIRLYNNTMNEKDADQFYYFNDQYFNALISNLKSKSFLGVVKYDEKVISTAIFFYQGIYGHYHLSGSDKKFLALYPNNFLIYKTALYLKEKGVKLFHLGGGSDNSEDNTLLKFKKRFSSKTLDFYIGKIIFDNGVYEELCNDWVMKNPYKKEAYKNYFLKYRC